jgi:hypothetical protein
MRHLDACPYCKNYLQLQGRTTVVLQVCVMRFLYGVYLFEDGLFLIDERFMCGLRLDVAQCVDNARMRTPFCAEERT